MKRILIINANPKSDSLCKSIAKHYAHVAGRKHELKTVDVGDMDFEINLIEGFDHALPLEQDLLNLQSMIRWSEHIVIVCPVWWGTIPAKFKAAIDRAFLPGFAFKYIEGKATPEKLLKGRTSELIFTLDTPPFWFRFIQGNPIYKQLKRSILDFTGIKNTSSTYFGPVISSNENNREKWLEKVQRMASHV